MTTQQSTRQTTAVIADDGSGIHLLHGTMHREDGTEWWEAEGQEWIAGRIDTSNPWSVLRAEQYLNVNGWRTLGDWRGTSHYSGAREADVERVR